MKIIIDHGFYIIKKNLVFVGPGFFEFNDDKIVKIEFSTILDRCIFDFTTTRNLEWKPRTKEEDALHLKLYDNKR